MTRRKDGRWQQQMTVTVNGRKKNVFFYGKTKAEVLKKIAAYKERQENGETFEEVADEWWEQHQVGLSPTTVLGYSPAYKRAVAHFEKTYIRQIKPTDITAFLNTYIKEKHASYKSAKNQLLILHLVFKYAVMYGYVETNPTTDITVPRNLPKKGREIASDEDIRRIKESTSCTFGMFAYWALYTGCRRGELLALEWADVDVESRTIRINKSTYNQSSKTFVKSPKTKAGYRTIPLLNKLYEKIEPAKGLVFPGKDGYITERQFQRLWSAYTKESGVTCTPHQLRHAYATMLFENDIAPLDAQELLGHANIQTTTDIYTHIREARKKEVRNKLLSVDIE